MGQRDVYMTNKLVEHHLREEFNRWAEAGRGDEMAEHHLPIVDPMLALIEFKPCDKVLDVGCGTGWLVRRIAPLVSAGLAAGMDVSDAMLGRAKALGASLPNAVFARGAVEAIPLLSTALPLCHSDATVAADLSAVSPNAWAALHLRVPC